MSELGFHKNEPYSIGIVPVLIVYFEGEETVTCTNGTKIYTKQAVDTCQFEVPSLGKWTISIDGRTYDIVVDAVKTYQVYAYDPILNNYSWDSIKKLDEIGSSIWSVGDVKEITLSGTFGTVNLSGIYCVYILGFNHNSSLEGNGISFGTFKTSLTNGIDICITDSTYGSTTSTTTSLTMNTTNVNTGGWNNSKMRQSNLGGNVLPSNAASGTLMYCFPSDLKAVIKKANKYTDNTGGGADTAGYVTKTEDYLYLLSEFEIQGVRTYANSAEKNYQIQYSYFLNGNSKIKYKHNATTTTAYWWTRSPTSTSANFFCRVDADGSAIYGNASSSYGVVAAFLV